MNNPFRGMLPRYLLARAREADTAADRALSADVMKSHRRLAMLAREAAYQEFGTADPATSAAGSPSS